MRFITLFFGVILVGILSFETGLRSDFSRNLQSDCIQLTLDQVFHSDNADGKFVKSKVLPYIPVHPCDSFSGYDSFMTGLPEFTFIWKKKSDYYTYSYFLPSLMDLPPPFSHSISC